MLANNVDPDQTPHHVESDTFYFKLFYPFNIIVLASIFLPNQELDRLYSRLTILNTCVGLKAKVNRLGDLSLPRKSVVRLTDRPNMTLDVYRGRKTTIQQQ